MLTYIICALYVHIYTHILYVQYIAIYCREQYKFLQSRSNCTTKCIHYEYGKSHPAGIQERHNMTPTGGRYLARDRAVL